MKNTKKTVLLASTATLSLSALAIGSVVAINSSNSTNVILNNNTSIKDRSISGNAGLTSELRNPDELFYMDPVLSVSTIDPSNPSSIEPWIKFCENIGKIQVPSGLNSTAKKAYDDLKNMSTGIEQSIKLANALDEAETNFNTHIKPTLQDLNLTESVIQSIWQNMRESIIDEASKQGACEKFEDIPGINDIQKNLLIISGIVKGSKIRAISGYASNNFNERNLSTDGNATSININSVAGQDYVNLVKIATIDPSKAGNYALKFTYKESQNSFGESGTIYILNDKNQLSSASDAKALDTNLDVFGRWDSNVAVSDSNRTFDNFIIQKNNNNKYEILVRVKQNSLVENIEFLTNVDGVQGTLNTPEEFGILDVQATGNTFVGKINNSKSTPKLVNDINSNKIITSVQMFSSYLTTKVVSGATDKINNRTLEFYQGPNSDVELGLYIAYKDGGEQTNQLSYKAIYNYENGISTGIQQKLTLSANGIEGSKINGQDTNTYALFKDLADQVKEVISSASLDESLFSTLSTISLTSAVDLTSKMTKQTLKYSDHFYGVGERQPYINVDVSKDIDNIKIADPTQKLFFEKPLSFNNVNLSNEATSTIKAEESVNEREQVISILGELYNQFSKSNSGDFAGENYNLGSINYWSSKDGKNINSKSEVVSGSANTIYQKLNSVWNDLSNIMNSLFGLSTTASRYDGSSINSAKSAVNNYLTKITEYTVNSTSIETTITEAIEIVKNSVGGTINEQTTYSTLSLDTKKALAKKMADLIKYQFDTISAEFESEQYRPVYEELAKVFKDTTTTNKSIIKSASDILEVYTNPNNISLIKYKDGAWNNTSTDQSATTKDAYKALFDFMYFDNGSNIKIGDAIFNTPVIKSAFNSLNSESLTSFESDTSDGRKSKVLIYDAILTTFGNVEQSFQDAIGEMLKTGQKIKFNFDIQTKLNQIVQTISKNEKSRSEKVTDSNANVITVNSFYIDDIISGTNAIICLNWKLDQIVNRSLYSKERVSNQELLERINYILKTNSQVSSNELSAWSNNTMDNFDYLRYSNILSGRTTEDELNSLVEKIIDENNIMKRRDWTTVPSEAVQQLEKVLKKLWWIIVALIGVGVLVASSVGVATKDRQVKLSSRPVLKWLLISGIVLGLAVAAVAIIIGVVVL